MSDKDHLYDAANKPLNPWHPISDSVTLKHIGKLQEELGELQAVLARCLIQGIDEVEPDTGKPNRLWLMEELADVYAGTELIKNHLNLDHIFILNRANKKYIRLREWHRMA